ncbi:hypothetical protein K0I63_16600 [Shewanella rhizosphaerae]|uniref:hypothetical protein n=1 Tax=Shewanella rhizosphaerae TaxID=2864207 RepID=UPI001C660725|nr:hypothetical protein [Shewanella rhizosphaerae]QYK12340.1 hypothetical protein K0I63_16600 [Shewanella rhizosphaerae]
MGWLDKAKKAAEQAKDKASELSDKSIEVMSAAKEKSAEAMISTKTKISQIDTEEVIDDARSKASDVTEKSKEAYGATKDKLSEIDTVQLLDNTKANMRDLSDKGIALASEGVKRSKAAIDNIDWEEVTDLEGQKANMAEYWRSGSDKVSHWARSTFEVDKNTLQMVTDLQSTLPVPASTVDDIFKQCREVATQRALSAFFLSNVTNTIDDSSAEKYTNLSEDYQEFGGRIGEHNIRSHENFSKMQEQRAEARNSFSTLEDGYNTGRTLNPHDADIEHVIAAKEIFDSKQLRAGTTDDGLIEAINSEDNLIFTNSSVNRSKGSVSLGDFLQKSEPHPDKPGFRTVEIHGEVHEISEEDCQVAYDKAQDALNAHKTNAALEIGATALKTGAAMAIQQVVGMIVVETIDIFLDEAKYFSKEVKLFDDKGLVGNVQEMNERLTKRLNQRFEERKIWAKAKSLGIEAGVSGAISVIPQILISTLTRLPAFALGMIREGTLSCVRSARVLASDDPNKLQSISIIMASTASAVVGLYVSRVISTGIASIPLLNKFNNQITSVLSGMLITAVPLVAIYLFDQNKKRFVFGMANLTEPEQLEA